MDRNDVKILENEDLYNGFFHMRRYRLRHRTFKGSWSETLSREVFERGPCAAVIPYDPVRDEVALIEQFRPGPMAAGHNRPWTIEIVAGILEGHESPEELALRETEEETGGTLSELAHICNFFTSPGGSTEYCHLYCGRIDTRKIGGIFGNTDEGEDIRVFTEPARVAFERIKRSEIASAFSIIALQWLMLNRESLRQRWT